MTVKNALPFTGYVPVSCAAYNGKYVLVMRNKAENKSFLAVYDADKLTLEGIINRNFNSVCLVMSGFYACDGSKLYKLTDKHERFFHSEKVALEKKRSLLELSLITRFPLKITVKSGRAYSEFRLAGSNRKQSIRLHSGGEEASFGFYSDGETCVEEAVLKTVGSGRDV